MRGTDNKDVFARGRYWVDAGSGRIARTELVFNALGTESSVTTSFEMDERLGTPVPVEMRFKRGGAKNEVRGTRHLRPLPPVPGRHGGGDSEVESRKLKVESRKSK